MSDQTERVTLVSELASELADATEDAIWLYSLPVSYSPLARKRGDPVRKAESAELSAGGRDPWKLGVLDVGRTPVLDEELEGRQRPPAHPA